MFFEEVGREGKEGRGIPPPPPPPLLPVRVFRGNKPHFNSRVGHIPCPSRRYRVRRRRQRHVPVGDGRVAGGGARVELCRAPKVQLSRPVIRRRRHQVST